MFEFVLFASDSIFLIAGIVLMLLVVVQMSFWVGGSFSSYLAEKKQFNLNLKILEQKLEAAKIERAVAEGDTGWNGVRTFRVSKLVHEAEGVTSIYLTPQDRRPLPFFRPGQFLTFSFDFPDEKKPVIRCYSLSDAPNSEFYRCTIKKVPAPVGQAELPSGKVSTHVNEKLQEGDLVNVKAPGGSFYLDLNDDRPVILLAGGIGITPIYSMLASIVKYQPHRRVVVFYGGQNSSDYALRSEMAGIASKHRNVHLVNCFSDPLPTDRLGVDFDVQGWVTLDLLKSTLPSNNFNYYLCGPGPFMSSLVNGLDEWGVAEKQIHFEAFGPASVRKVSKSELQDEVSTCKVRFSKSKVEADWSPDCESILELAEEAGVELDSGCRAGNCGSCEIGILKGKVTYSKELGVEPGDGNVITCVSKPDGDLEVDA